MWKEKKEKEKTKIKSTISTQKQQNAGKNTHERKY